MAEILAGIRDTILAEERGYVRRDDIRQAYTSIGEFLRALVGDIGRYGKSVEGGWVGRETLVDGAAPVTEFFVCQEIQRGVGGHDVCFVFAVIGHAADSKFAEIFKNLQRLGAPDVFVVLAESEVESSAAAGHGEAN